MIKLRNINSSDIEDLFKWRTNDDVQRSSIDEMKPSMESHILWFNSCDIDSKFIVEVENNKIGTFSFNEEQPHNKLIWSFHLNPDFKGKSYNGEKYSKILCNEALNFAFKSLNANKVIGYVLSDNEKSVRLHLSLGFKEEGFLKQEIYKNNKYLDLYRFGLLKEEYNK